MALDLNALKHLTDAQKESYMKAEKFFASEFWPWLQTWAKANAAQQLDRVINAETWEFNRLAYGARFAYDTMANLENITNYEFEQLAQASLDAEQDAQADKDLEVAEVNE